MKTNGVRRTTLAAVDRQAHAQERDSGAAPPSVAHASAGHLPRPSRFLLALAVAHDVGVEAEARVVDEDPAVDLADVDARASRRVRSRATAGARARAADAEVLREVVRACRAAARRARCRCPASAAATVLTVPSPPPRDDQTSGRRTIALRQQRTELGAADARARIIGAQRRRAEEGGDARAASTASLPPPEPALTMTSIEVRCASCAWRSRCLGARTRRSARDADREPGDALGERRADVAQVVHAEVPSGVNATRAISDCGGDDRQAHEAPPSAFA